MNCPTCGNDLMLVNVVKEEEYFIKDKTFKHKTKERYFKDRQESVSSELSYFCRDCCATYYLKDVPVTAYYEFEDSDHEHALVDKENQDSLNQAFNDVLREKNKMKLKITGTVEYFNGIRTREVKTGLCPCGQTVILYNFINPCDCGRDYNSSGQLLAPREQWGEETGESLSDILRIP